MVDLKQMQKVYINAKSYIDLLNELPYEYKIRMAKEYPKMFENYNTLDTIVKEMEDMGVHLTLKKRND